MFGTPPSESAPPIADTLALIQRLKAIAGHRYVLTQPRRTRRYRVGFRFGGGPVLAVVRPGSLLELWHVLQACVAAHSIVILQAANTGLTGGSTPYGSDYDRPIVLISTLRMARIYVIEGGRQVICLPGATLYQLEKVLRAYGRTPHSVIGSSCIGASVLGGICNNSGGSLIRRGPAFTQRALYARLDERGRLQLVNHLGVELGNTPETILTTLDQQAFQVTDIASDPGLTASDHHYAELVRDVDADTPARFNADPRLLFEASGSAGKVAIFAVRLDTFARDERTAVFYIGSNDASELEQIRRHMLTQFTSLPIAAEYLHRNAFDIAEKYGKDMFLAIQHLGTDRLPPLFAFKARVDDWISRFRWLSGDFSDKALQALAGLFPSHLPKRLKAYRDRFEHHLMLRASESGIAEMQAYLSSIFPSRHGAFFECGVAEGEKAFLHRFAAAGAAVRYRSVHRREVEDIVSLDVALRRNDREWTETLPDNLLAHLVHRLYYGHFFCHVIHKDYLVRKGHDPHAVEHQLLQLADARGAEYPAEHNVGHLYRAKPSLINHYRSLDPCNAFNPGIGGASKQTDWR